MVWCRGRGEGVREVVGDFFYMYVYVYLFG
jgi:hypothetical protein